MSSVKVRWCTHKEDESVSRSVMCHSLWPHGLQSDRLLCLWSSPGKNTGVGCHSLLQGIFLTQRLNLGLPHCRQILYHLSHQGSTFLFIFFFKFWPHHITCVILVPCPGIKHTFPVVEAQSLNHWTTGEVKDERNKSYGNW